jgi:hypothetical protein
LLAPISASIYFVNGTFLHHLNRALHLRGYGYLP